MLGGEALDGPEMRGFPTVCIVPEHSGSIPAALHASARVKFVDLREHRCWAGAAYAKQARCHFAVTLLPVTEMCQ